VFICIVSGTKACWIVSIYRVASTASVALRNYTRQTVIEEKVYSKSKATAC